MKNKFVFVVLTVFLVTVSSLVAAKSIDAVYPNKYKFWSVGSSIVATGEWNVVLTKTNDSSSDYHYTYTTILTREWQWHTPIPIDLLLIDEKASGVSTVEGTSEVVIPPFETFKVHVRYITRNYYYECQKGEIIVWDDDSATFKACGPVVKFYKTVIYPEEKITTENLATSANPVSIPSVEYASLSHKLLQSITYPYYLPTWQNGEFWQYSISKTASESEYAIYHKWLVILPSTVTAEKYVVLQMRYFDDIPAYEYVILKEIHTNKDEILDIAYAPICNLSISSLKESLSYDFDFPLYVGKKWQVLFPTIKSSIHLPKNLEEDEYFPLKAEVDSTQTIITPAGKFNTIMIKERYNNGKTYEYWYSPKAKNYVKFLSVNGNTEVLTKYGKIEDLKSYVAKMIKAMPKKYASQRSFVVNTLYQYGFFTFKESLELLQ